MCYGLNKDLSIKQGQIAHIDKDNSNNAETNLLFLSLFASLKRISCMVISLKLDLRLRRLLLNILSYSIIQGDCIQHLNINHNTKKIKGNIWEVNMNKMKLFCIPYAGGMSSVYASWKHNIYNVEVISIKLKGREQRENEGYYKDIQDAVKDIKEQIMLQIRQGEKFGLFGHSMGALIAYELYYELIKENLKVVKIFFSARRPPHIPAKKSCIHEVSLEKFKAELMSIGGTPKEFFNYPELMEIFIPIIRADFRILYNYEYIKHQKKISCDVILLCGKKDDIPIKEIIKWDELTNEKCHVHVLNGGHFFINELSNEVKDCIVNEFTGIDEKYIELVE